QGAHLAQVADEELAFLARQKAAALDAWFQERLGDAQATAGDPLLRECLAAAAGPARQRLLEERLRGMDEAYHYAAAFLVGPGGELLAAAGAKPPDAFEQAAGRDAWDGPATRVVWDVLSSSSGPSLRLDFVAAILAGSPARRRATLVLRTDPASVTAAI